MRIDYQIHCFQAFPVTNVIHTALQYAESNCSMFRIHFGRNFPMLSKPSLVLLPGSLSDEQVWAPQARALADMADIHIPHILGPDTLSGMAEAVIAHAPERFALCGFSMGGRVALEVYRRIPERVTRLALVSASIHSIAEGEDQKRKPLLDLAVAEGMEALAEAWLPRIVHPDLLGNAEFMGPLHAMALRQTPDDYVREVRALLTRDPVDDVARSVTCPVLVIAGDRDPLSTPARNADIQQLIPHARLVTFENCAHFPMLEYPERTSAELRSWLND